MEGLAPAPTNVSPIKALQSEYNPKYNYSPPPPPPPPPPNPTPSGGGGGSGGGGTPPSGGGTSPPSTGLSKPIETLVSALNAPPPTPTTPPTVPIIPALGPNFVGWAPWQLIQQWGTAELLRQYLDLLRQQFELRNSILEGMAREGRLPITPVPVITEEEVKRPIGLRVHYIPM